MEQDGVFLITDAAHHEGELYKLGDRVAFLKKTNYGSVLIYPIYLDLVCPVFESACIGPGIV